ncbi:MAG: SufS family cysteine desulfurase [Bacteroides sp.]|nr:MAG: SufS family cysteine desulfurase [Bacteroides sp.]
MNLINKKFNVDYIRSLFPILDRKINGNNMVYFDNAATTQKPISVIDSIKDYYINYNSNIHRSVNSLSNITTEYYEKTRIKVQNFINANSDKEIIFTKGTTDSINMFVQTYAADHLSKNDNIILSISEHHSNILPWQNLSKKVGFKINYIKCKLNGEFDFEDYKKNINYKTKIISISHVTNVTGHINSIKEIIDIAHHYGATTFIDCAQSVNHILIDVQALNCDFLAFSSHKMYGPMGVGILYGKQKYLKLMRPYQFGGSMVVKVYTNKNSIYSDIPYIFEAGTPNVGNVIALGYAIDFINLIGINYIELYIKELHNYLYHKLSKINNINIIGNDNSQKSQSGIISFSIKNLNSMDIGILLDTKGIIIRTGMMCAMPLVNFYKFSDLCRISLAIYNTKNEIDICINNLDKIVKYLYDKQY